MSQRPYWIIEFRTRLGDGTHGPTEFRHAEGRDEAEEIVAVLKKYGDRVLHYWDLASTPRKDDDKPKKKKDPPSGGSSPCPSPVKV